jgi:predicted SprT family Zn-dependent metalloprotease
MFKEDLDIPVTFNNRLSRSLGLTFFRNNKVSKIDLSSKLKNNINTLLFVLKHELIHVYCINKGVDSGHGEVFKSIANSKGVYTVNPRTKRRTYLVTHLDKDFNIIQEAKI